MQTMTKHEDITNGLVGVATLDRSPPAEVWGSSQTWEVIPAFGLYRDDMPAKPQPHLDRRRRDFGNVVARALSAAKLRGMTIKAIEEKTGIGSTTFYGWRDGRWTRDPVNSLVNQFFDGLGIPRDEAYRALGWTLDPHAKPAAPEPIVEDPDVRNLMRILSDPNVSPREKLMIRRWLRSLEG